MRMDKLNSIEVLHKLVYERAISFIKANEQTYEEQYGAYVNTFNGASIMLDGQPYIIGIDLANGEDITAYSPHKNS